MADEYPNPGTVEAPQPGAANAGTTGLRGSPEGFGRTRRVDLAEDALTRVHLVFRDLFGAREGLVVADRNTWAAAGGEVQDRLRAGGLGTVPPLVLNEDPLVAEQRHAEAILEALGGKTGPVPVAVGSGVINDLVKYAAHCAGRQYLCVATAASMDGYAAFGSSITRDGAKSTCLCPAPLGIVADLKVISAAPAVMASWGYADLLAKVTAGADWIVADALGVEPLHAGAWELAQGNLRDWLANPAAVAARHPAALKMLLQGLLTSGFAMQAAQSSRPASGAEHQFSHLWDMQHHTHRGVAPSHGFKVGVALLTVARLYEFLLAQPLDELDVDRCCRQWPSLADWLARAEQLLIEPDLVRVAHEEMPLKYVSRERLRDQLTLLKATWPALRARLKEQLPPVSELKARLMAAGAPVEPGEIGISESRLRKSHWQAYCIRRRFTVLDLAVRTGLLDPALQKGTVR